MFSIKLKQITDDLEMEIVSGRDEAEKIMISSMDINRPGLQLVGFYDYFGNDRLQIMGKGEMAFLESLTSKDRIARLDQFFGLGFPCLIITRSLPIMQEMIDASVKYKIPLLRTADVTSRFMSKLISYLSVQLAPRITRHADLVEVYGEGILICGESGVGKSEIALELVKRGHRLVADDLVEIRKVSDKSLVGNAPDMIRYMIEIRGIGILDVKNMYGVGSVKMTEKINLVMNFERWDNTKVYERLGLITEYTEILGLKIPSHTIPVSPGRNLAVIVEVAAMNNRQKMMGYNAAEALLDRREKETGFDEYTSLK